MTKQEFQILADKIDTQVALLKKIAQTSREMIKRLQSLETRVDDIEEAFEVAADIEFQQDFDPEDF